ncbi:MAG TPA: hypothetical protein VFR81_11550, partial [Longimicrobium sp.]|nr:hypothetical protein [Longimicrobium sp.]
MTLRLPGRRTRRLGSASCAALALLAACGGGEVAPAGELELREATALEVPGDQPVAGIAATDSGMVAAWSDEALFLGGGAGDRRLRALPGGPARPVGAAFLDGGAVLEAVGVGGDVVRFGADGRVLARTNGGSGVPVQVAVHASAGWVGGG